MNSVFYIAHIIAGIFFGGANFNLQRTNNDDEGNPKEMCPLSLLFFTLLLLLSEATSLSGVSQFQKNLLDPL